MQKTKIGKLPALIKVFDKAQKSVVFYGTYGIGKSEVVYQSSQQKAIDCNKTFIDWMRATDEDKRNSWLYLTKLVYEVNCDLLNILAIDLPEKM